MDFCLKEKKKRLKDLEKMHRQGVSGSELNVLIGFEVKELQAYLKRNGTDRPVNDVLYEYWNLRVKVLK
ncbi:MULTISPECIES: hypothetical protein [Pontibacillus]|uniref:Uncharacterized protein n=1 Tax=Pontibacillus chungwhensis TaxID=265426 RepID=A0ABY8V2X4_9BACI|nr:MULTISPECIES: hypothetical protein [Pontibacillus]MCD5326130.1 hypothetical protein [Pontibacillus sp. HN14]WIG00312.1 hypothetical protein QNI29_20915 [Pontibacillus chungwhensis]